MIILKLISFFSLLAYGDSYSVGVERIKDLQKRTSILLGNAGLGESSKSSAQENGETKSSILRFHSLPTTSFIPTGGLAFGKTYFRLLVGEEPSPIEIIFSLKSKYPFLSGMKAMGTTSQTRGRIFGEFDRLVTRSGKVIPIKAQLLDSTGALGLRGENENSKTLEILGGVGLGLLAAPNSAPIQQAYGDLPRANTSERLRSSLFSETRNYLRDQFKESPVLRLDENTNVTLLFLEEVRF